MTTPYRNDNDALRGRKESLEQELEQLREHASVLETLRAREREVEKELASISEQLDSNGRRALPMLDQVRVASPCNADWNEMIGDDRVRFCLSCEKNVYNLSAMPREDAERLLAEREGKATCVRFYQRADGTIMTDDCPVGVKKKRRKKLALAVAGAGAMAAAALTAYERTCQRQGEMVMGAMPVQVAPPERAMMGEYEPAPKPPTAPISPR